MVRPSRPEKRGSQVIMIELVSTIEIDAPAERVWQILTDFAHFPEWNPFMLQASGPIQPGARLQVYLKPGNGMGMTFRPTVLRAEPNHELRWLGQLFVPGLFDGEHQLSIESLGPDQVRFTQREKFTGVLASPILSLIGRDTQQGFEEMNRALKVRAEKV